MTNPTDLSTLTDAEVERCLNHVLSGYAAIKGYDFKKLLAQQDDMIEVVQQVSADPEVAVAVPPGDVPARSRAAAARVLLAEMAASDDPDLKAQVAGWLESDRKTLLEPITTALVLAGLVTFLSTKIEVGYDKDGKKKKIHVKVEKPSASKEILKKIASFF